MNPSMQVGALPWRIGKDGRARILLVTARDKPRWIIPKGHRSKKRRDQDAAAREAREEAGVKGIIADPIGQYLHRRPRRAAVTVTVYELKVTSEIRKWRERDQRRRKWVTPRKAVKMIADQGLRALLASFVPSREADTLRQGSAKSPPTAPATRDLR